MRLASARGHHLSEAERPQCYLSPRPRSQETMRILAAQVGSGYIGEAVFMGDDIQGIEGRGKFPGFSLLSSPTTSQPRPSSAKPCWKTTDGETWETQAAGANVPDGWSRAEWGKAKNGSESRGPRSSTEMEHELTSY